MTKKLKREFELISKLTKMKEHENTVKFLKWNPKKKTGTKGLTRDFIIFKDFKTNESIPVIIENACNYGKKRSKYSYGKFVLNSR